VLTRGYKDIQKYDDLIKRNNHISQHLRDKSIPNVIFHEGNITVEHQTYIRAQTPELETEFIDVSNVCFQPEKKNIPFEEAEGFDMGYRHMCSFWFVNFFDVVKYDQLLRIDEDCFVTTNLDAIFVELDTYTFITAICADDDDYVTKGLNQFSLDFMHAHANHAFKNYSTRNPRGPYTNFFALSLTNIRNNTMFQKYRESVDANNFIYKRRWGDLPLWGEVICYIFGNESMKIDPTIQYFHGSHKVKVNALDPVPYEEGQFVFDKTVKQPIIQSIPKVHSKPVHVQLNLGNMWSIRDNNKTGAKKKWNLW